MSDRHFPNTSPNESSIIHLDAVDRIEKLERLDGHLFDLAGGLIQNSHTGQGIRGRDSSITTTIGASYVLTEFDLRLLFRHNWLIKRVVTLPAKDMVRAGVNLAIHDGDSDDVNKVMSLYRGLGVAKAFRSAEQWARLFGRSYIVIRVNGDEKLDKPLRPEKVRSVDSLWVYDRYQLKPAAGEWNLSTPEFYQLVTAQGGNHLLGKDGKPMVFGQRIHKSRVLVFSGDELPPSDRQLNEGCDDSVVQKMFDAWRKYYTASGSINEAINSFSILTVSIAKLSELLAAGKLDAVKSLVREINLSKSVYGTLVTDSEVSKSDFQGRNLSGVEGLFVNIVRDELTAASELPFYKLWGQVGKASLADSGGAESKAYADLILGWQEEDFREAHEYLFPMLMQAELGRIPEDWEHEYNSLYSLPPKEEADIFYIKAQAYEKLAAIPGVVNAEEIREAIANEQDLSNAINLEEDLDEDEDEPDDEDQELENEEEESEEDVEGEAIDPSDDEDLGSEGDRGDSEDYFVDDALWDEAAIEAWGVAHFDAEADNKLYFFEKGGVRRRTGIISSSAAGARKKCRRGCGKLYRVRQMTSQEKKQARAGKWVRSGPSSSQKAGYGTSRGYGPPRSKKRKDSTEFYHADVITRDPDTGEFILWTGDRSCILGRHKSKKAAEKQETTIEISKRQKDSESHETHDNSGTPEFLGEGGGSERVTLDDLWERFDGKNEPTDKALWQQCVAEAKRKMKIWPSAYGSLFAAKLYRSKFKQKHSGGQPWKVKKDSDDLELRSDSVEEHIEDLLTEIDVVLDALDEVEEYTDDLRQWLKEKWVRIGSQGQVLGSCSREPGEPKPKCLPLAKARSMSKEERIAAVRRKRREDPNPDRKGKAIHVSTHGKKDEEDAETRSDALRLTELPTVGSRVKYKGRLYVPNKPYRSGDRFVVLATRNGYAKLVSFTSEDVDLSKEHNPHDPAYWANLYHSFGSPQVEEPEAATDDRTDAKPIEATVDILDESEFEKLVSIDLLQTLENIFEDGSDENKLA